MSIDVFQNRPGELQFVAGVSFGTTGTASTVASNQYPGGYQFGNYVGYAQGSNSTNGLAPIIIPIPRTQATTDFQSYATTGTITHDNAGVVLLSISTTGIALNLQPASFHGQMLTIVNIPGTTCSIGTGCTTTGFGGTTTAACKVIDVSLTLASTEAAFFQAYAQLGGTATTNVAYVWHRLR